jgi:hypothetical protein
MPGFVEHLLAVEQDSFLLMLALCACATAILKAHLDRPVFVAFAGAAFLPSALICRALMLDLGLTPTADWLLNLVVATAAGILMGFSVVLAAFIGLNRAET